MGMLSFVYYVFCIDIVRLKEIIGLRLKLIIYIEIWINVDEEYDKIES